jgi:cell division protein FtsZ
MEAAQKAISSPLLEEGSIHGARGVLLNITGGEGLSLHEVSEASTIIQEAADPEANIIFGSVINKQMKEDVIVTVIATGFEKERVREEPVKPVTKPLPSKSLDRPAFLRKVANGNYPHDPMAGDDEWDVPTFLRKQAD